MADNGTDFEIQDDLTVLGEGGDINDADVEFEGEVAVQRDIYQHAGQFAGPFAGFGRIENLLTYSQEFDNSAWTRTGATVGGGKSAPDQTSTAYQLANSGGSGGSISQSVAGSGSTDYVFSVWLKAGDSTSATIEISDNGNTPASNQYAITSLPDKWKRYEVSFTSASDASNITVKVINNGADTTSIYIWGAQLEQADHSGVYIKTGANPVSERFGLGINGQAYVEDDVIVGDESGFNNNSGEADLYVKGNLEVDGTIYGALSGDSISDDSLDWDKFADNMTLDATTSIDMSTKSADLDFGPGTLYIDNGGNVGIGESSPNERLSVDGVISLKEQGASPSSSAGYGKIYVKDDGNLYYKDDAGNEVALNQGSGLDQVKQLIKEFVVASGESVSAGDVVAFLNGYIKKGFPPIDYGSESVFNSADSEYISVAALDSSHFVVAYRDVGNSYYGTAVVGTVSGSSISFGGESVFNSANTVHISVAALDSSHFVVAYRDVGNSDYGTAVVGTVSGSSISFGSEYVFNSASTYSISVSALDSSHFVVAYDDQYDGTNWRGTAVVGTVSGNSISLGSEYVFNSAATPWISASALDSSHFVVAYEDNGNSRYGTAVVGTVSGNSISFGSEYVFNAASTGNGYGTISVAALDSSRFVVAYRDVGNSDYGTAVVGTVSGNNISFGGEYVFNSATTYYISASALDSSHFVVAYQDRDNGDYGTAVVGEVSGNSISFGGESVFNSADTVHISVAALDSSRFVVAYRDNGNSNYGTAVVGDVGGLGKYFIGVAKESGSAGQSVPVIISGVADVYTGLTPGEVYYATEEGDITTSPTDYRLGLAISSTEILLNGDRDNVRQFFGDLYFKNNFKVTEASSYQGLILKNQLNQEVMSIDEHSNLSLAGNGFTVEGGNVGIGTRSPGGEKEAGRNVLSIADGKPPLGGVSGQVSLYSKGGELYALDSSGNATQLSPHDPVTGEWIYHSTNTRTGKVLDVKMERLVKFIDEVFGTDFVKEVRGELEKEGSLVGEDVGEKKGQEKGFGLVRMVREALELLGVAIKRGVARIKEVVAERIKAEAIKVDKIEMVDVKTGDVYCVWFENGVMKQVKGRCREGKEREGKAAVKTR